MNGQDTALYPSRPSQKGEPTWDIARCFPVQGQWTEEEYLALETNHFVELSDGCLEFLPMPSPFHQFIVRFIFQVLDRFVLERNLGETLFAPMPVWLRAGTLREPDIAFFKRDRLIDTNRPPRGADLVVEVVSEGTENRKRDLETKRTDYALAGIAEYWIVDPEKKRIFVLTLKGDTYSESGVYSPGSRATSVLLPGFELSVSEVFEAGLPKPRTKPTES